MSIIMMMIAKERLENKNQFDWLLDCWRGCETKTSLIGCLIAGWLAGLMSSASR